MGKILFGLGNPGKEFASTRHNVGVDMLREWERQVGQNEIKKVKLIYPQSFMNDSGTVLLNVLQYSPLEIADVLIIHDDMELPSGEAKIGVGGSAKGHNGVRSIYKVMGTPEIARLRIGIGRPLQEMETKDYVLGKFNQEEKDKLKAIRPRVFGLIDEFINEESRNSNAK